MAMDISLICLSLSLATRLRPLLDFLPFAAYFPVFVPTPWPVYLAFALEWVLILLLFAVYDGRRNMKEVDEFISLTLACALAAVTSAGTLYLSFRQVSRLLFLTFVILAYASLSGWRMLARLAFRASRIRPQKRRKVLILGSTQAGQELRRHLADNPHLGLSVVELPVESGSALRRESNSLPVFDRIEGTILQQKIEEVVITLPQDAYQAMNALVGELHRLPVRVWVVPDYFRLAVHKAAIEQVAGIPMLNLRAPALNEYQRLMKRLFDLAITLSLLPLALPILALTAIAVRLSGPGSILLRQERVGENGRLFRMFKFRTMRNEEEETLTQDTPTGLSGNKVHKRMDDPRVTPLGRLLRRYSLDELPQLFNVLKGEMSLVGPRPELPYLVAEYQPWQRQRFAVPQGMTGWWQIHGRSDKPMHLNTEDDLYYVQNYSILLDLYILVKTIGVVVSGKGAF